MASTFLSINPHNTHQDNIVGIPQYYYLNYYTNTIQLNIVHNFSDHYKIRNGLDTDYNLSNN